MKHSPNQQAVWNRIAPEWYEFKTEPSPQVIGFLKKQKGSVLDLGSGAGRYLTKIKGGKMYLVDFSENMLKLAEKKAKGKKIEAEFAQSDISKLPFKDNFFDSAISISAIHCLETQKARSDAVEELYRVLKPKSQTFIGVWNKNSKRFKKAGKEKFVNWRDMGSRYYYLFEEEEIHNLFKKAGFEIIESLNSEAMINFIAKKP